MDTSTAVCRWIHYLGPEIPNDVFKSLELRQDGCGLQRINRLHRWLMGNYSMEDFVQSELSDPDEIETRRFELRKSFITQTILEGSQSSQLDQTGDTTQAEPHPLSLSERDSLVRLNLTNSQRIRSNSRSSLNLKPQMSQNLNSTHLRLMVRGTLGIYHPNFRMFRLWETKRPHSRPIGQLCSKSSWNAARVLVPRGPGKTRFLQDLRTLG